MLFSVIYPNRHTPAGIPCVPPYILLRGFSFVTWPSSFLKQLSLPWRITPRVQQYGEIHQVGNILVYLFWFLPFPLLFWLATFLLGFLISPWSRALFNVSEDMSKSLVARRQWGCSLSPFFLMLAGRSFKMPPWCRPGFLIRIRLVASFVGVLGGRLKLQWNGPESTPIISHILLSTADNLLDTGQSQLPSRKLFRKSGYQWMDRPLSLIILRTHWVS